MLYPTNRSQHFENQIRNKGLKAYFIKLSRIRYLSQFQDFFWVFVSFTKHICEKLIFYSIFKKLGSIYWGKPNLVEKSKKCRNSKLGQAWGRITSSKCKVFGPWDLWLPSPQIPPWISHFLAFSTTLCSPQQIGPNILKFGWKISNWEHI